MSKSWRTPPRGIAVLEEVDGQEGDAVAEGVLGALECGELLGAGAAPARVPVEHGRGAGEPGELADAVLLADIGEGEVRRGLANLGAVGVEHAGAGDGGWHPFEVGDRCAAEGDFLGTGSRGGRGRRVSIRPASR
ncbi:MAG: hypothetical protein U5Q44_16220 [Dehalococcoidia bacterium]|nr:hypothetical protein [Dehalococcoidia bacterium]